MLQIQRTAALGELRRVMLYRKSTMQPRHVAATLVRAT